MKAFFFGDTAELNAEETQLLHYFPEKFNISLNKLSVAPLVSLC